MPNSFQERSWFSCDWGTFDRFPGQSPAGYWSCADHYHAKWNARAAFVAALIEDGASVCDIGCGMQALRRLLPSSCKYLPCDLKQWTADTEVCDLNANLYPLESLSKCTICVLLGVMEYLWDPGQVIAQLRHLTPTLLFSYNPADRVPNRHPMWINSYSTDEVLNMARKAGYPVIEKFWRSHTLVLRAGDGPRCHDSASVS
jgi:hypothetical protein